MKLPYISDISLICPRPTMLVNNSRCYVVALNPVAMRQVHCREVYFLLAALCLLVGATTTHGLGGSLRHKQTGPFTIGLGSDVHPRQPDPVTTWRFYQPFR